MIGAVVLILVVFALALIITDVYVSRRRNDRAIEEMRRQRGAGL